MAYDFNGSSTVLYVDQAVVTAAPWTMSVWVNKDADTLAVVGGLFDKDVSNHQAEQHTLANASGFGSKSFMNDGASNDDAYGPATVMSVGTWYHLVYVATSTTSRTQYQDGVAGTPNTTSVNPTNFDRTALGTRYDAAPLAYIDAKMCEWAFWNVALNASEIAALAKKISPRLIRPASLRLYRSLIRNQDEPCIGPALSSNGSPAAVNHIPVICPF